MEEFLAINAVIFLIGFFTVILPVVLAYIVYRDADSNGIDVPFIWAMVTFFMPFIGIMVYYLVVKPSYTATKAREVITTSETNVNSPMISKNTNSRSKEKMPVLKSGPVERY